MKGVILSGGTGTRLKPLTSIVNKHLIGVYNKPMILYPLETLKSLGIYDILIISGGEHIGWFTEFLGDGSDFGVELTYKVQKNAGGIAHALGLAKDFVGNDKCAVILGDNIFDNRKIKLPRNLATHSACVFVKKDVDNMNRFGVLFESKKEKWIIEKPNDTKNALGAITGLYIYPPDVFKIVKTLKPSKRGELEITDVNNHYLKNNKLECMDHKGFWSDAGTFESLFKASEWVRKNT